MFRHALVALVVLASPASAANFDGEQASKRWFDAKFLCENGSNLESGVEASKSERDAACQEFAKLEADLKANGWCVNNYGSAWSRYCPDYSRRATADLVRSFANATKAMNKKPTAVMEQMEQHKALEDIVRDRAMKSVYDCLPELRVACFDAIVAVYTGKKTKTVFDEWGEWVGGTDQETMDLVSELLADADARGFDLLSDPELEAAKAP